MKIIRFADLAEVPWRNGAGVTREIAASHEGEKLIWRISMADVAVDGAFSDFAGLMRILTVIDGAGMDLDTPDGTLEALPGVPVRFDGGLPVTSRLRDGALRDLNLFFAPDRLAARVEMLSGPSQRFVAAGGDQRRILHCLAGSMDIGRGSVLQRADTVLLQDEMTEIQLHSGAAALFVQLDPLSQA